MERGREGGRREDRVAVTAHATSNRPIGSPIERLEDLVELQVPKLIVLQSETVLKENVDKYRPLGFKS